jgi:hypothetical protein
MTTKTVYQYSRSGLYVGETLADESPLEPGVWLLPAYTTEDPPPADCPPDKIPKRNGIAWALVAKQPEKSAAEQALEKLQAFMAANPDVAALMNQGGV